MEDKALFGLCICTYKRPRLLEALLEDSTLQSIQPGLVIVVDGDAKSGEVVAVLEKQQWPRDCKTVYIPSNHGNQTYQRYLGWRVAKAAGMHRLLYLDDDLRIRQTTAFENIIAPLDWPDRSIAGVTGSLVFGETGVKNDHLSVTLTDLRVGLDGDSPWVARFGASRAYIPGEVTPSGNRVPVPNRGNPYESVKWMRGGAMAFNITSLSERVLSDDIFAMNHRRYGLCEDLIIARRLLPSGELLQAFNSVFEHPGEDPPKAYSNKAFDFGYSMAYSRRWFNDNYRGFEPPRLSDRLQLSRFYLVSCLLHVYRWLRSPGKIRFLFAMGYLSGILGAITRKPTARVLTPQIDWWADAEMALQEAAQIQRSDG